VRLSASRRSEARCANALAYGAVNGGILLHHAGIKRHFWGISPS
jgi:hypothetical protein